MAEIETPGRAYEWPLYQGTKQLKATSMNKADYCELRGWEVPANEDPNEAGYCVEYQDGGVPNVEGFAGYVSWSPADVFVRSYRRCGSHVERMEIEWSELVDRIYKLRGFIIGGATTAFTSLPPLEQGLLMAQLSAMEAYKSLLSIRLGLPRNG